MNTRALSGEEVAHMWKITTRKYSNLLDRLGVIWQTGYIPVKVLPELDSSLRKSRSSWEPSYEPHALKLERQMLRKWRRNAINENPSKKETIQLLYP